MWNELMEVWEDEGSAKEEFKYKGQQNSITKTTDRGKPGWGVVVLVKR